MRILFERGESCARASITSRNTFLQFVKLTQLHGRMSAQALRAPADGVHTHASVHDLRVAHDW